MTDEQQKRLDELLSKPKSLTPSEKGELKALQKLLKKAERDIKPDEARRNVFGKVATTKIKPTPIRFLETEVANLQTISDSLVSDYAEVVIAELGSLREVNNTKLIRAAVELLNDRTPEEIIEAIKKVQLKMIRKG